MLVYPSHAAMRRGVQPLLSVRLMSRSFCDESHQAVASSIGGVVSAHGVVEHQKKLTV